MQKNAYAGNVTKPRATILWLLPLVGILVLTDEIIKRKALDFLPDESSLTAPGIVALAIHKNWGVAFDIPFKMQLILIISAVIGVALLWVARKNFREKPVVAFSALTIVFGAAGNMYDRVAYGFTVDYLILFGRSAINVSDIVIVTGVVLLLYASRVPGLHQHGHPNHDHDEGDDEDLSSEAPAQGA